MGCTENMKWRAARTQTNRTKLSTLSLVRMLRELRQENMADEAEGIAQQLAELSGALDIIIKHKEGGR